MRNVKIFYNPYLESTRLFIDDVEHSSSGTRYDGFIVGKNIENWLNPYALSYHRWDGILCELMEALNDDELRIAFYSSPRFFPVVRTAVMNQNAYVEEKGYDASAWSITWKEYYSPEKIVKNVERFIYSIKHFLPDQYCMNLFDFVDQKLAETAGCDDEEKAGELYRLLSSMIEAALKAVKNNKTKSSYIAIWEKAKQELLNIYWGK